MLSREVGKRIWIEGQFPDIGWRLYTQTGWQFMPGYIDS